MLHKAQQYKSLGIQRLICFPFISGTSRNKLVEYKVCVLYMYSGRRQIYIALPTFCLCCGRTSLEGDRLKLKLTFYWKFGAPPAGKAPTKRLNLFTVRKCFKTLQRSNCSVCLCIMFSSLICEHKRYFLNRSDPVVSLQARVCVCVCVTVDVCVL